MVGGGTSCVGSRQLHSKRTENENQLRNLLWDYKSPLWQPNLYTGVYNVIQTLTNETILKYVNLYTNLK